MAVQNFKIALESVFIHRRLHLTLTERNRQNELRASDRAYIGKENESDWLKRQSIRNRKEKKMRVRLIGQERQRIKSESRRALMNIGQHLLENPSCASQYTDTKFSILARG